MEIVGLFLLAVGVNWFMKRCNAERAQEYEACYRAVEDNRREIDAALAAKDAR